MTIVGGACKLRNQKQTLGEKLSIYNSVDRHKLYEEVFSSHKVVI